MPAFAYIVECVDGTYYTGWTNDLEKRMKAHNSGRGAKYTRARLPVRLAYVEAFEGKREAMRREAGIKKLKHKAKQMLIEKSMEVGNESYRAISLGTVKGVNKMDDAKKVMLTEEGYNKLVEKLNYLKSVRRIEIAERLKAAIALGDLSENSEYDDAKNEQAFLEGEILDLEAKIRNSHIIQAGGSDIVQMGSKVKVKDVEFDEEEPFMLVGSTEADPDEGKISNESPLGQALLGQKTGSKVTVKAPAGNIIYEIMEILA